VIGDEQQHAQQQEHEHTFEQERKAGQEVNGAAVDERKQQTPDQIWDGFAARQQRERLTKFVFTDKFTDEQRRGLGLNVSVSKPSRDALRSCLGFGLGS